MDRPQGKLGSIAALNVPWLLLIFGGWGCATETAESGEACTRTAQCAAGLACIDGECSADLQGLDSPGNVPMLMPEPSDGGSDGGSDASTDGGSDASTDGGPDASVDAGGGADAAPADDDAG